jgi:predicted small lipoprotein YifL
MKKTKISSVIAAASLCALAACGPKPVLLDLSGKDVPDNERCQFMKESCKEASEFQNQYERMSPEEKQDAKAVLNAYVQQCQDAQEMCRKTME